MKYVIKLIKNGIKNNYRYISFLQKHKRLFAGLFTRDSIIFIFQIKKRLYVRFNILRLIIVQFNNLSLIINFLY